MEQIDLRVTAEDYQEFVRFGKKCQADFGLNEWNIVYTFEEIEDRKIATIEYDITTMSAKVTLNEKTQKRLVENNPNKFIRQKAFHEIYHLVIAKLGLYIDTETDDGIPESFVDCEKHTIINRMIKAFNKMGYFEDDN